ncbi:unnamed protein product [Parnassius mnemosyne]|uniref:DDE Tnp4 domain-containing protein n=1 Tax=Parnassius mnemosyne TaxID=213953 RepID=A0AAV1LDL8_9NEOP
MIAPTLKITKPRGIIHTEQYRNRKGYFSLNVQVVGGPNLMIYDIVVRWAGSTHDSRIFRNSRLNIRLCNNEIDGMLLADGGYPCTRHLLTPVSNPRIAQEERYNKMQIKSRNAVELLHNIVVEVNDFFDVENTVDSNVQPYYTTTTSTTGTSDGLVLRANIISRYYMS